MVVKTPRCKITIRPFTGRFLLANIKERMDREEISYGIPTVESTRK